MSGSVQPSVPFLPGGNRAAAGASGLQVVSLSMTGGANGTQTAPPSYTYSAADINGNPLGMNLSPSLPGGPRGRRRVFHRGDVGHGLHQQQWDIHLVRGDGDRRDRYRDVLMIEIISKLDRAGRFLRPSRPAPHWRSRRPSLNMAVGDRILKASGKRILTSAGKRVLDDGMGNGCGGSPCVGCPGASSTLIATLTDTAVDPFFAANYSGPSTADGVYDAPFITGENVFLDQFSGLIGQPSGTVCSAYAEFPFGGTFTSFPAQDSLACTTLYLYAALRAYTGLAVPTAGWQVIMGWILPGTGAFCEFFFNFYIDPVPMDASSDPLCNAPLSLTLPNGTTVVGGAEGTTGVFYGGSLELTWR
jgi:hypothetical protein